MHSRLSLLLGRLFRANSGERLAGASSVHLDHSYRGWPGIAAILLMQALLLWLVLRPV